MNIKILLRIGLLVLVLNWCGDQIIMAQESTDRQVDELLEVAIGQMNNGEYEDANLTFRRILKMKAVFPDQLSYLFAETLYMVHQYHNSRSFLDKYLRLAGPNGRYYSQAMDLKRYLDDEYELILVCKLCDSRGYRLIPCDLCHGTGEITDACYYCMGVGVNLCEVCKGNGVTTSLNAFSELQYHTCPNCLGKGQVPCKVCHGEKVIRESCPDCHGTHKKPGSEICDHEEGGSSRAVGAVEQWEQ